MKILLVFALFTIVLAGPAQEVLAVAEEEEPNMKYFLVETGDGKYRVEDLVNAEIDTRVSESDLTFHFFSRHNLVRGTKVRRSTIDVLRQTEFRASKDTLFAIHGWVSSNESNFNYYIRDSILSQYDINFFIVDWERVADLNYISAKNSVVEVGRYVAAFIDALVSRYGVRLSNVALVGHSLGAHIAGNAGAALSGRLHHIVGLDPAWPLFSINDINNRLDPTDANFVEVIHTNGGKLGFLASIGHADYFPNGGKNQAGCGIDLAGTCSHSRAYAYYAESVATRNSRFISNACSSYSDYNRGRCNSNAKSFMGGFLVDTRAKGDHYLDTNRAVPYAKG